MSLGFVAKQRTIDDGMVREVIGDLDLDIGAPEPVIKPQFTPPPAQATPPSLPAPVVSRVATFEKRPVSMSKRLGPQLAMAGILVVALSWLGIQAKRRTTEVLASPGTVTTNSSSSNKKGAMAAPAASQPVTANAFEAGKAVDSNDSMLVEIMPNDTLFEICMQSFGRYDEETVAKIQQLNPWLKDPNRIEAGQEIRVPVNSGLLAGHGTTTERLPAALSNEAEKP